MPRLYFFPAIGIYGVLYNSDSFSSTSQEHQGPTLQGNSLTIIKLSWNSPMTFFDVMYLLPY